MINVGTNDKTVKSEMTKLSVGCRLPMSPAVEQVAWGTKTTGLVPSAAQTFTGKVGDVYAFVVDTRVLLTASLSVNESLLDAKHPVVVLERTAGVRGVAVVLVPTGCCNTEIFEV